MPTHDPIDTELLWARVRLAREGAAVERCHAHPHLMRYSVGHHSLDMLTLVVLAWQAAHAGALPRAELLVAVAFHDVPERITGDCPRPMKELMGGAYTATEDAVLHWLGASQGLTSEEQAYLHAADKFELWLWSMEEVGRGNHATFWSWALREGGSAWMAPEGCPEVFHALALHVSNGGGRVERLEWKQLKEIAGL